MAEISVATPAPPLWAAPRLIWITNSSQLPMCPLIR